MVKFTNQELEYLFKLLPLILNRDLKQINNNRYIGSHYIDGSLHQRTDKTFYILYNSKILIEENGDKESCSDLIEHLLKYHNFDTFGKAIDYLKTFLSSSNKLFNNKKDFLKPKKIINNKSVITGSLPKELSNPKIEIYGLANNYLQARGIIYSSKWNILNNIGTAIYNNNREDIVLLLRWIAPTGEKAGLYYVRPYLVFKNGIYNKSFYNRKPKFWVKNQGILQTNSIGGAIRTGKPKNGIIGICEGIEDALSIMQMTGYFLQELGNSKEIIIMQRKRYNLDGADYLSYPVWAVLSKQNIIPFEPPKEVHTIYLFLDMDKDNNNFITTIDDRIKELNKRDITIIKVNVPKIKEYQPKDWNSYLEIINKQERGL